MNKNAFLGKEINGYRIVNKVASGGFGSVFRAEHVELKDCIVATKILHANLDFAKACESLRREAQWLVDLKHPYILRFIHYGTYEDYPYLMTEYAANGSLRERIRDLSADRLQIEKALTIVFQIGQALRYAHQRSIFHRDLKPENVLFNDRDEALLADFGIAKMASTAGMKQGRMGTGTPHYMAPEQFNGEFSAQSDQYSFGCILYELVTGRPPFRASGLWELIRLHTEDLPIDPRQFNSQIPSYVADATLKALAKRPGDRHVDIETFLTALGIPLSQETIHFISWTAELQRGVEELLDKGKALSQKGHYEDALKIYDRAIHRDPGSAKAYCGKGDVLIMLGRNKLDALASYNQAISFDPEFIPAYIGRGDVLCSFGDYQEALEAFQKALQAAPDSDLYQRVANILTKCNRYEEALAAYNAAIHCKADPIEITRKKIHLLEVYLRYYRDAAREYDTIIQLSSDPVAACYEKLNFQIRHGLKDEARTTYDQIIELQPGVIDAYYGKIAILEELGCHVEGVAVYDRVIEQMPDVFDVYCRKANFLERHDRTHEVPAVYDQFIKRMPQALEAHSKKLDVLLKLEWFEEALVVCERIIKLVPHGTAGVHLVKLGLLERLTLYDQAVSTCDKIIEMRLNCTDIDYADIYYRKGKLCELLEISDESINKKKGKIVKGLLMLFLGVRFNTPIYYKQALDAYHEASQISPGNLLYRECRATLLEQLGKVNQANKISSKGKSGEIEEFGRVLWIFFLLPLIINSAPIAVLGFLQPLWVWISIAVGTFCISASGAYMINVKDQCDQKYHLYDASILIYPISCFAVEWLIAGLLISLAGGYRVLVFTLPGFLVLGFLVNTLIYSWIDAYEEQTVTIIRGGTWKIIKGFFQLLRISLIVLGAFLVSIFREYQEHQRAIAAQRPLYEKSTVRKPSGLKAAPTTLRNAKHSSPSRVNSFKKSVNKKPSIFPKQSSTTKKTNYRH